MKEKSVEIAVGGFVINPENKLLLIRGDKWNGAYVVPGGHVEFGETFEQALIRELHEETGLAITNPVFLGIQEAVQDPNFSANRHFILVDYMCQCNNTNTTPSKEAQEFIWVTRDDALKLPLGAYTQKGIDQYQIHF